MQEPSSDMEAAIHETKSEVGQLLDKIEDITTRYGLKNIVRILCRSFNLESPHNSPPTILPLIRRTVSALEKLDTMGQDEKFKSSVHLKQYVLNLLTPHLTEEQVNRTEQMVELFNTVLTAISTEPENLQPLRLLVKRITSLKNEIHQYQKDLEKKILTGQINQFLKMSGQDLKALMSQVLKLEVELAEKKRSATGTTEEKEPDSSKNETIFLAAIKKQNINNRVPLIAALKHIPDGEVLTLPLRNGTTQPFYPHTLRKNIRVYLDGLKILDDLPDIVDSNNKASLRDKCKAIRAEEEAIATQAWSVLKDPHSTMPQIIIALEQLAAIDRWVDESQAGSYRKGAMTAQLVKSLKALEAIEQNPDNPTTLEVVTENLTQIPEAHHLRLKAYATVRDSLPNRPPSESEEPNSNQQLIQDLEMQYQQQKTGT